MEDEQLVRNALSRSLKRLGYRILAVTSGREALDLAASGTKVDLVMTDVMMPQMTGPELVTQLRRERPLLPVIYISGYTDGALGRDAIRDERVEFLQKPIPHEVLSEKIRLLLDQSSRRVEAMPATLSSLHN